MNRRFAIALGGLVLAGLAGPANAQYGYPYPAYPVSQPMAYPQPPAYGPMQCGAYMPNGGGMPMMNPWAGYPMMRPMPQPMVVPMYIPVPQTQYVPVFGPLQTMPEGGPLASMANMAPPGHPGMMP